MVVFVYALCRYAPLDLKMFVAGSPYTPAKAVSPGAVLSNCGALLDISRLTGFSFLSGATVLLSCAACTCTSLCVAGCSAGTSHKTDFQTLHVRAASKGRKARIEVPSRCPKGVQSRPPQQ